MLVLDRPCFSPLHATGGTWSGQKPRVAQTNLHARRASTVPRPHVAGWGDCCSQLSHGNLQNDCLGGCEGIAAICASRRAVALWPEGAG